jgi:hypothetical protein
VTPLRSGFPVVGYAVTVRLNADMPMHGHKR